MVAVRSGTLWLVPLDTLPEQFSFYATPSKTTDPSNGVHADKAELAASDPAAARRLCLGLLVCQLVLFVVVLLLVGLDNTGVETWPEHH